MTFWKKFKLFPGLFFQFYYTVFGFDGGGKITKSYKMDTRKKIETWHIVLSFKIYKLVHILYHFQANMSTTP